MSLFVSDLSVVAQALADPTRRRVVTALSSSPARTKQLADAAGVSVAALSRHLAVLRDARLVERVDVVGDGRGREYRLVPTGMDALGAWMTSTRWTSSLAAHASAPFTSELLGRLGAFLDGFATGSRTFFERHLADDVQLIFPDAVAAYDKQGCLDSVGEHPAWVRYDIEPGPIARDLGSHSLLSAIAVVEHSDDTEPRRVFITACFHETEPWQLIHLQWTNAATTDRNRG
jgi:DNA-binding transcriptional ArsR family regulator